MSIVKKQGPNLLSKTANLDLAVQTRCRMTTPDFRHKNVVVKWALCDFKIILYCSYLNLQLYIFMENV